MAKIDFHIHSCYSDGKLTPYEIVNLASEREIKYISITDHDTIKAYSDDLFVYANKKKVHLVSGVELSTQKGHRRFHILGYNIDLKNIRLIRHLQQMQISRTLYLDNVANKLKQHGFVLDKASLKNIESVTKAHIAQAVIDNPLNAKKLNEIFKTIPQRGMFIETLLNEGCPCYVKREMITPAQAARIIRGAGGIVVLAHPVAYLYENNMSIEEVANVVTSIKADGLETKYLYVDKDNRHVYDNHAWHQFAKDNNLIETSGSDFHFHDDIHPDLGELNEKSGMSQAAIDYIVAKKKLKRK